MQSLDLDLASRPFKNNSLLWAGLVLAVVLLGSLSAWNVKTYRRHAVLLEDLRGSVAQVSGQFADLDVRYERAVRGIETFQLKTVQTQTDKANEVIRWKAFSWTRLFNLMQEVQPWDVQMRSIRPVFRSSRSRRDPSRLESEGSVPVFVEGVAETLDDFLEFERGLMADPHFDRVEPEGYDTEGVLGATVFRVRFLYKPALEPDAPAGETLARVEVQ